MPTSDLCIDHGKKGKPAGYSQIRVNGKKEYEHRVAFCDANGLQLSDIADILIRHTCDNPRCISPAHLLAESPADNMQDKVDRGRCSRLTGARNGRAKLNSAQVEDVRSAYAGGKLSQRALASKYQVAHSSIGRIIAGLRWAEAST